MEDPDGYISFVLDFDGRLLDLKIADAILHVMTNLELEARLNRLIAAGEDGVDRMRADLF